MRQQLRFDPMNAGRLLQRLDNVVHHLQLNRVRIVAARRNEQVSDHAFAALVDEEGIAHDAAAFDRRVAR